MSSHKKLKEFAATAICGNDITSSCLYVSSLAIMYAGQYAWISLLIVAAVLFLFRKIYGEAVGALPLNGGAYNILLNTTSKSNASIAACLTILSYMATAVLSGTEAMHYLHNLVSVVPVFWATIILLTFFLIMPLILLSGLLTPVQNMPYLLEKVTYANPLRFGIDLVQRIYLEGATFQQVKWDFVPMLILAVLTLPLAAWLFRNRLS